MSIGRMASVQKPSYTASQRNTYRYPTMPEIPQASPYEQALVLADITRRYGNKGHEIAMMLGLIPSPEREAGPVTAELTAKHNKKIHKEEAA